MLAPSVNRRIDNRDAVAKRPERAGVLLPCQSVHGKAVRRLQPFEQIHHISADTSADPTRVNNQAFLHEVTGSVGPLRNRSGVVSKKTEGPRLELDIGSLHAVHRQPHQGHQDRDGPPVGIGIQSHHLDAFTAPE